MQVELFHGPVTPTESIFYAQIARPATEGDWKLSGTVRGPLNHRSDTLPATYRFDDAGPGETVLAKARIPDPCGWSMDLPSLYETELQLTCDGKPVDRFPICKTVTGFRDFGAVGQSLSLNGERWVVRGKLHTNGNPFEPERWREERLVCVCDSPSDAMLQLASEQGVSLFIRLKDANVTAELARVAVWPAVLAVILDTDADVKRPDGTNVLVGRMAEPTTITKMGELEERVDFVCTSEGTLVKLPADLSSCSRPIIALGTGRGRPDCDRLQAKLAPRNLAGYIVGRL